MNVTEKRRSFLINVMYFAVLIGLFFLFFKLRFRNLPSAFDCALCGCRASKACRLSYKKSKGRTWDFFCAACYILFRGARFDFCGRTYEAVLRDEIVFRLFNAEA